MGGQVGTQNRASRYYLQTWGPGHPDFRARTAAAPCPLPTLRLQKQEAIPGHAGTQLLASDAPSLQTGSTMKPGVQAPSPLIAQTRVAWRLVPSSHRPEVQDPGSLLTGTQSPRPPLPGLCPC